MWRAIVSVIAGYVALSVWVAGTLAIAWAILGPSFAFQEGTTMTTTGWSVLAIALGIPGAMLGGFTTALIARTRTPILVLAGIVLVLGLAQGIGTEIARGGGPAAAPSKPVEELSFWEAPRYAMPPTWYGFTIPLVGCAGALAGGALRR
jgi:hypothetical protein